MRFAFLLLFAVSAAAQTVVEYPLASGDPRGIALGPDGNIWFTERLGNRIGRITSDGIISEFDVPTPASEPMSIVTGPDGNLWFTESAANKIGRITPEGVVTGEFSVPIYPGNERAAGITAGPDGNVWFTTVGGVGRISVEGEITMFSTNYGAGGGITSGPDGNLWFTAVAGWESKICRITPSGVNTAFGDGYGNLGEPSNIAAGPDGNLWFTETTTNRIGRVDMDGTIAQFGCPFAAFGIVPGLNGTLWITVPVANRIAQITTDGAVALQYSIPTPDSSPVALAVGNDGSVWFTEAVSNKIGRIVPPQRRRSVRR